MLWTEFESFKKASQDVEAALHAQVDDQEKEIRRLTRLLMDEQSDAKEYRVRLSQQQQNDMGLSEKVSALEEQLEAFRFKNRQLEDNCERLERSNHTEAFMQKRLEDERDAAQDRAILAEYRVEELEECCTQFRVELQRLREENECRAVVPPTQTVDTTTVEQPNHNEEVQLLVQQARDEAARDMKIVAQRIRHIASLCTSAV